MFVCGICVVNINLLEEFIWGLTKWKVHTIAHDTGFYYCVAICKPFSPKWPSKNVLNGLMKMVSITRKLQYGIDWQEHNWAWKMPRLFVCHLVIYLGLTRAMGHPLVYNGNVPWYHHWWSLVMYLGLTRTMGLPMVHIDIAPWSHHWWFHHFGLTRTMGLPMDHVNCVPGSDHLWSCHFRLLQVPFSKSNIFLL
jgi:hypothetical protein